MRLLRSSKGTYTYNSTSFDLLFSSVNVYLFPQKNQIAITLVKQICMIILPWTQNVPSFRYFAGLQIVNIFFHVKPRRDRGWSGQLKVYNIKQFHGSVLTTWWYNKGLFSKCTLISYLYDLFVEQKDFINLWLLCRAEKDFITLWLER